MKYGLIETKHNVSEQINAFGGLNRSDITEKNEFSDMCNMSSDRYPYLTPSKAMKKVEMQDEIQDKIRAVIAPEYSADQNIKAFTGVAGKKFYYNGEVKSQSIPNNDDDDMDVTLVDFNGRIIICVYGKDDADEGKYKSTMLYYDYTAKGTGNVEYMEKGIREKNEKSFSVYSLGNPKEDITVTNCIQCSEVNWKESYGFKEGDSVFIEGFSNDVNNTVQLDSRYQNVSTDRAISCIVEKVDGSNLYVQMYNRDGNRLVFTKETNVKGVKVYTKIPTMNHVCIHNNRLWGTNPNGEYIYASKLGDPFNFNTFQGLANDSFYAEIGTAGGFVGIVSYRDNLVAFKRDYIHHIYGDKPSNFTIPKQLSDCGCIDIQSAVQVGSTLFFLGYGGIYAYVGGQPELISQKLDRKYTKAVGMTDGQKYIVYCKSDTVDELLVLDTRYGLWHREWYVDKEKQHPDEEEKYANIVGAFKWHDKLYIASDDAVYEYGASVPNDWACESVIIHDDTFNNKGMTELWIRAKLDEGAEVTILTSEDGGDFLKRATLKPQGLKVYRIPIRFINGEFYQYRLEGKGNAVIYSIERVISSGGRPYKK